MKTKKKKTPSRVTEGSGNVFADLGLPNPEQELSKPNSPCKSTPF